MKHSHYLSTLLKSFMICYVLQMVMPMKCLYAQSVAIQEDMVSYFIPFNDFENETIYEIRDHYLSLEYVSESDTKKEFVVDIYDWQRNKVSSLLLDKTYGLNQYNIDLSELGVNWEYDKLYSCETKNAQNGISRALIKLIPLEDKGEPYINIFTNPLSISCEKQKESIVEYYAEIDGGRPPYNVQWFVLDDGRSNLVSQPTSQVLTTSGTTSAITVNQPFSYNVMLLVEDACGNERRQAVYLQCHEEKPTVNTLFIEPIKRLPNIPKNTN